MRNTQALASWNFWCMKRIKAITKNSMGALERRPKSRHPPFSPTPSRTPTAATQAGPVIAPAPGGRSPSLPAFGNNKGMGGRLDGLIDCRAEVRMMDWTAAIFLLSV
jgi:hypothetical protein